MHDLVIFAVYTITSAIIGFTGDSLLGMSAQAAPLYGFICFLICIAAHEAMLRRRDFTHMQIGFEALSNVLADVSRLAEKQKKSIADLTKKIEALYAEKQQLEDVRIELDILQKLVTDLSGRSKGKTQKTKAKVAIPPKSKEVLLESVRDALRGDRVDLYLQPIVTLPQRKARFYECYSRIRNKKGELILPQHYIEAAEQEGLIAAIDNMLLFRCIQLIRKAHKENSRTRYFCNLSRHTLFDEHFFGDFIDFLEENHDLAQNLTFEVDQDEIDNKDKRVKKYLKQLTDVGCRLCVQKVTTLRFDLKYLASIGVSFVKIESDTLMQYVDQKNPGIDLTKLKIDTDKVGIDIVVEKIEDEQVLLELLDYNIDYGQGYLFGEPVLHSDMK